MKVQATSRLGVRLIGPSLIRMGLEQLISSRDDLVVLQSCAALDEVTPTASDVDIVDLVIVAATDIAVPGQMACIAAAAAAGTLVVILGSQIPPEDTAVVSLLRAGVAGCLLLDSDESFLFAGLFAAARGECPVDPRLTLRLLSAVRSDESSVSLLTARERAVLELVADGLLNKQIARQLGISEPTVKSYLTRTFQRIGVTSRTEAAMWLRRQADEPQSPGLFVALGA
jgi:DNA-binding NarL/FixJ family response regulator